MEMEKLGDLLARLETGAQEPSTTSKTCAKCGVEHNGPADYCHVCVEEEFLQERKAEAEERLKEAIRIERARWAFECGLPLRFRDKSFDNFDRKLQVKAYDAVNGYNWRAGNSLVLISPELYGVGKTHLAAALVNHLIATEEVAWLAQGLWLQIRRCPVFFTSEPELLARIRATYNRRDDDMGETEEDVYRLVLARSLLVLDDVGKNRPKDLSFVQSVYFRVIDGRYAAKKPIVLTTNLGFEDLEAHVGGACADRLREMCGKDGFVLMKGQSYRKR